MSSEDFIPLTTDEYKMAFCQALEPLCNDMKIVIWNDVIRKEKQCPNAPKKIQQYINRWNDTKRIAKLAHATRRRQL